MIKNNKNGFTLIELLVVIAIIGLLAGMFMGTFSAVRKSAKKTNTKSTVKQVKLAWKQYLSEYNKFPSGINEMDSKALKIISGKEKIENYKEIPFLDFSDKSTDKSYTDPWGNVYQVRLDEAGNNSVTATAGPVKDVVAVWSYGPDGIDNTKDDINSWK